MIKKAFTMMELVIALAIVAILALVTIPLAKNKMEKVDRFSYYIAYAAVQDIAANIVAQSEYEYDASDLATSSVEDIWNNKQYVAYEPDNNLLAKYLALFNKSKLSYLHMYAIGNFEMNDVGSGAECPATQMLNGRCYTEYMATGHTCGWSDHSGDILLNAPSTVWKRADACDEHHISVGEGYVGVCLWGGASPEDGVVRPSLSQPNGNYGTKDYIGSAGWYCFKYKDTPQTNPTTNPEILDPTNPPVLMQTCPDGSVEIGGSCASCASISTWDEYKGYMPPCPPDCARFGMIYSASKKTCVMPASATNFCERIKSDYNISTSNCTVTASQIRANVASGFKDVDPHIKLSNGVTIYIASDLVKVDLVADAVDVRDRVGYLLYVDTNGSKKGKGILYQDVFPFYILMTGKVLPVYNPSGVGGANNVENLSVNVLYDDYSTGNRVVKASQTNVDYQTGACATKFIQSANYCKSIPVDAHCTSDADCRFVVNKPMKFFGR